MSPDDSLTLETPQVDFLHATGRRIATSDQLHQVLDRVVEFVSAVVRCDSCFVYVLEGDALVLRGSKTPHPDVLDRLRVHVGQGITGWVAEHRQPVVISSNASQDPRFKFFNDLPEDHFAAFLSVPLLSRGRLVGVINVQHRKEHNYSRRETNLIATIGFLAGAEIELARLHTVNSELLDQLETRKLMERAKGILQRTLGITEEEAYLILQKQSRQRRKSMKELAEAMILGEELKRTTD